MTKLHLCAFFFIFYFCKLTPTFSTSLNIKNRIFPPRINNYVWGARQNFNFYSGITNIQGDLKTTGGQKPLGWLLGTNYYCTITPSLSAGVGVLVENFNFKNGLYGEFAYFSHVTTTLNVRYQVNNLFKMANSNFYPYAELQFGLLNAIAEENKIQLSTDLYALKKEEHAFMASILNLKIGTRFFLTEWIALEISAGWGIPLGKQDLLDFIDPSNQTKNAAHPDKSIDYKFALHIGVTVTIKGERNRYSLINSRTKKHDTGKRRKVNKNKLF